MSPMKEDGAVLVTVSVPRSLLQAVDVARGDISRNRFVTKILRKALERQVLGSQKRGENS